MNRRDLLKLVGIGGVGAVVTTIGGKEEVQAAPVVEAKPVEPPPTCYPGTASWFIPGRTYMGSVSHYEYGQGDALVYPQIEAYLKTLYGAD